MYVCMYVYIYHLDALVPLDVCAPQVWEMLNILQCSKQVLFCFTMAKRKLNILTKEAPTLGFERARCPEMVGRARVVTPSCCSWIPEGHRSRLTGRGSACGEANGATRARPSCSARNAVLPLRTLRPGHDALKPQGCETVTVGSE